MKKDRIVRGILLVIGIALLLNTLITLSFSNYHLGYLVLGIISVVLIAYALLFEKVPKLIHIVAGILGFAILAFMVFLHLYGTLDNVTYDEDAIIVLGASIRGDRVTNVLARRLNVAIAYYGKNPDVLIVVSGGQGPQEDITEALAMKRYLVAHGISEEAIIEEGESTSTMENLMFSKEILDERFPEGFSSVIVTNSFHVYRATRMADTAGIPSAHVGAPIEWYTVSMNYIREVLAVLALWMIPGYGT